MRNSNPYPRPTAETVASWPGYLYMVWEREAMRIAKENGHAVLTDDPVLARYRFTNIRRRDDRMTKWFIEHLIEPAVENGDRHLWFTLLIGRLINWPPTLQALLNADVIPCRPHEFDADRFSAVLEGQKAKGLKVYGEAYMCYPTMKDPGGIKSASIAKYIIGDAVKRAPDIHTQVWAPYEEPSIERAVEALSQCFGIGTFIAGQVAADMSYTPGHLGEATDLYSWAPLGPGSQRGLNFLYGKVLNHTWKQGDFNTALSEANLRVYNELDISDLTLHDQQNCACEFSKYVKAVQGLGKPKSTYRSQTAY